MKSSVNDSTRPLKRPYWRVKIKLLYVMVFIFCLSAFASSKNECACPAKDSGSCVKDAGNSRVLPSREVSKEITKDVSDEGKEFSTFQLTKLLFI